MATRQLQNYSRLIHPLVFRKKETKIDRVIIHAPNWSDISLASGLSSVLRVPICASRNWPSDLVVFWASSIGLGSRGAILFSVIIVFYAVPWKRAQAFMGRWQCRVPAKEPRRPRLGEDPLAVKGVNPAGPQAAFFFFFFFFNCDCPIPLLSQTGRYLLWSYKSRSLFAKRSTLS
jgi:hypothetical protein